MTINFNKNSGEPERMRGAMKLKNANELVLEVLEMTGFADVWEVVK